MDRAALEALGVSRIEIEIAENVALLPVPRPGDPDPITEGEAALFTGPLRHLGSLVVDGNERARGAFELCRFVASVGGLPTEDGDTVFLYEVYADQAAIDHHMETPYMKEYMADTGPMIANRKRRLCTLASEGASG